MNPLDLAYINRLAPYKVWTENGRDYLVETGTHLLFRVGFMDRLADGNNKAGYSPIKAGYWVKKTVTLLSPLSPYENRVQPFVHRHSDTPNTLKRKNYSQKNIMGRVFRCFCSSSLFMRWIAVLKKNATKNSSVPSVLIIFRAEIYSERFSVLMISKG